MAVTSRACLYTRRAAAHERAEASDDVGVSTTFDPLTRFPAAATYAWDDTARLLPDDRALLAMRFLAGFDSNELAAATGISPSGTRSRIERLLRRLREDLGDG